MVQLAEVEDITCNKLGAQSTSAFVATHTLILSTLKRWHACALIQRPHCARAGPTIMQRSNPIL